MSVIGAVVGFLGRFAPQAMAAGVFVGLILPDAAALLRPYLAPAVWGLLFLSMLRIDWGDLMGHVRRPALAISINVWMLIVTPVLVALLAMPFDLRPGLVAGMVLAAASSSLFSTPTLGVLFGLDGALLLIVLVVGTLLVPVTLPIAAGTLLGFDMGADPADLFVRMGGLVVSALVAALAVRRVLGGGRIGAAAPALDGTAVILLIAFAVGIMEGVTARLRADPADVAHVIALAFAVYVGLMAVTFAVFRVAAPAAGRRGALSAGFVAGTRNLAIIIAVLPDGVDPDVPLFFAMGQFPIYIMPMVLKPVIARLSR